MRTAITKAPSVPPREMEAETVDSILANGLNNPNRILNHKRNAKCIRA